MTNPTAAQPHTKGPWKAENIENILTITAEGCPYPICDLGSIDADDYDADVIERLWADAELIASAPQMQSELAVERQNYAASRIREDVANARATAAEQELSRVKAELEKSKQSTAWCEQQAKGWMNTAHKAEAELETEKELHAYEIKLREMVSRECAKWKQETEDAQEKLGHALDRCVDAARDCAVQRERAEKAEAANRALVKIIRSICAYMPETAPEWSAVKAALKAQEA